MSYKQVDTQWMSGNFGVSVHWTSHTVLQNGKHLPYEDAVNAFDVERFADTLQSIQAKHCIFTLTHAEQYLAMPNPHLERLLPGRTTKRDLIGEIICALNKRGIRFIAYYNHSCNGNDDVAWKKACGYDSGIHGNLDGFAQNICDIVAWIGNRYGKSLSAWWFDSGYSVDPRGPINTISCDIGNWQFPWEKLVTAAKCGNEDAAVAVNAGIGSRFLYTDWQDYYCGETVRLDEVFHPDALPEIRDHRWTCADSPAWVFLARNAGNGFAEPRFSDGDLQQFITTHQQAGRMVTLNLLIDQSGVINPKSIEQLKRIQANYTWPVCVGVHSTRP